MDFDFSDIITTHYNKSFLKLEEAMKELDVEKQRLLIEQCNSGSYWDKFASITGKLFLFSNLDKIHTIYNSGIDDFIYSIGL